MRKEAQTWFKQAGADLEASKDSLEKGHFEWSCFQSQQSAEKALKACLYHLGYTSLHGHSVKLLLKQCVRNSKTFSSLEDAARTLDNYYIPTRYPNGLDEAVAPTDYYDEEDGKKCVGYATSILTTAKKFLKP